MVEHWAFNLMVAGSSPATPRLDTSSNYMITKESVFQRSLRFGPVVLKGPSIVARLCSQIAPCTHLTPQHHLFESALAKPPGPKGKAFLPPPSKYPPIELRLGLPFYLKMSEKRKKKSSFRTFPIKTGQRSRTQRRDFNEEMKKGP